MQKVLLGREVGTGKDIWLSSYARLLGTYVVGLQGMGKTNFLAQVALQDIANGDGVCVISPHPDLIEDILVRIPADRQNDVIVFDPTAEKVIGINVFEWDGEEDIGDFANKVTGEVVNGIFQQLWGYTWGPEMALLMKTVATAIGYAQTLPPEKRPTLREFDPIVGTEPDNPYREYLLNHIRDNFSDSTLDAFFRYWQTFEGRRDRRFDDKTASTLNKAREFSTNRRLAHVIGQSPSKLNLQEVMDQGKILLVELDAKRLGGAENVGVIGSLLTTQILLNALGRSLQADNKQFHLIIDEFRYFALSAFGDIQDQTRKYGVDLMVAHQRRGQLTEAAKDATKGSRNRVVLAVHEDDAEELAAGFDSSPPPSMVRRASQDFGLASYPLDALKRQSHENEKVVDLVHQIDEFVGQEGEWEIRSRHYGEYLKLTGRKILVYEPYKITNKRIVRSQELAQISPLVNRYLYLRMKNLHREEADLTLQQSCNYIFDVHRDTYPYAWDDKFLKAIPQVLVEDLGESAMEQMAKTVQNKTGGLFVSRETHQGWCGLFGVVAFRRDLMLLLTELGDLLEKQPVYVRGGEPVEDSSPERTYSDVTNEWQNRFAHLPQYEAWVRVQEERHIREYHIETIKLDDPPEGGAEVAQSLRQTSQDRYGRSREEIEEMIRIRMGEGENIGIQLYQDHDEV